MCQKSPVIKEGSGREPVIKEGSGREPVIKERADEGSWSGAGAWGGCVGRVPGAGRH